MLVYNTPTLHTRMSNVVDVADPTAVLARAPFACASALFLVAAFQCHPSSF